MELNQKFKDVFEKLKTPDNFLLTSNLGKALRYLSYDPTESEITDYIKQINPQNSNHLTIDEFLLLVNKVRLPFTEE